jgi:mannosyl-3-phosphoglycerate phosphatase family protein
VFDTLPCIWPETNTSVELAVEVKAHTEVTLPLIIVSDLDGTLLDHETYGFDAALPALERLRRDRVPVVLCTSKTRAEVEPLRAMLGNEHPFIVENGGAVIVPHGYFPFDIGLAIGLERAEVRDGVVIIPLGDPYRELVAILREASRDSGVGVRGFADMSDAEVAASTGLSVDDARLAKQREFDEPFEVLDAGSAESVAALAAAIARLGKRWTAGGRFHHITGANDKAAAVRILADLYRRDLGDVTTIGLGDALNDVDFLREVDRPVVIESPNAPEMARRVPGAVVTRHAGPAGWNEAVLEILDARRVVAP